MLLHPQLNAYIHCLAVQAFVDFESPDEAARAIREKDHKVFAPKFGDRYVRLIQVREPRCRRGAAFFLSEICLAIGFPFLPCHTLPPLGFGEAHPRRNALAGGSGEAPGSGHDASCTLLLILASSSCC